MFFGKRCRLSLLTAAVFLVTILSGMNMAAADGDVEQEKELARANSVDNTILVLAGLKISTIDEGAEPGEAHSCTWELYVEDDLVKPIYVGANEVEETAATQANEGYMSSRLFSSTGRWFQAHSCNAPALNGVYAVGTPISLAELIGMAEREIEPPPPDTFGASPPLGQPDRHAFVRLPTWFWIDEPYRSTVLKSRVNFPSDTNPRVWTEGTAVPYYIQMNPGDGTGWHDACNSLGIIRRKGMAEDRANCTYTYTRSSAGQPNNAYELIGRVYFKASWTSSISPGGDLDDLVGESAPIEIRVGEILIVSS